MVTGVATRGPKVDLHLSLNPFQAGFTPPPSSAMLPMSPGSAMPSPIAGGDPPAKTELQASALLLSVNETGNFFPPFFTDKKGCYLWFSAVHNKEW